MFGIHRRIFNAMPAAVTSLTITLLTSGLLAVGLLPGASDARRASLENVILLSP